jgi:hypothetical protein
MELCMAVSACMTKAVAGRVSFELNLSSKSTICWGIKCLQSPINYPVRGWGANKLHYCFSYFI